MHSIPGKSFTMGRSNDTRGRLVPLSVPLQTPQLALLRSLRSQADELSQRIQKLVKLEEQLKEIPDEPRWGALVPVPSSSSLAYARGSLTNTNTVMVHFDMHSESDLLEKEKNTADAGYWVEYSAKQARGVAQRRQAHLKPKLDKITADIAAAEEALSSEMGFHGGRMNQNYELLNEEGLPFVEIQEFEEEDELLSTPQLKPTTTSPSPPTPSNMAPAKGQNLSKQSASTSQNASLASSPPQKTKKSVSFAHEDDYEPSSNSVQGSKNDEDDLPVIASQEAAASAGLSKNKVAPTAEVQRQNDIMTSSFADLTIKPTIVAKDTTKPPPVLTAAERSANKRSRYDVAAEFDGAEPKKVDLSAYLPRQLRGIPIAATFKGKARAMDQDSVNQPPGQSQDAAATMNGEEEYEHDDLDDSDDPDYLDDYDTDEDSDDDNTHIDDILAMREAAMEYHAKRHALGAGTGTGPLGGTREQDAFDEPGLTEYDKGGLPIVESYDDNEKRPSRFRKSRLDTAQMVIPDIEVTETILPGDSLGPFEDEEDVEAGAHGTNDFKGMSKEEVETFLKYVKALETGEELQDLRVVSASDAPPVAVSPLPMDQKRPPSIKETKKSEGPAIGDTVVEKKTDVQPTTVIEKPTSQPAPPAEQPKRVSRFRSARSGNA